MNAPLRPCLLFLFAAGFFAAFSPAVRAAEAPVFELRTYTAVPGKFDAMVVRLRDHAYPLFERHGIVNVGYWVPLDAKDGAGDKIIYLLQYKSRESATAAWKAFQADPDWQAARTASETGGKLIAKSASVFLAEADYSPANGWKAKRPGTGSRVFELRTYTAPEGRLGALDARFRDHTLALFSRHGMANVIYLHPLDAAKGAGRTLVYLLGYPNRDTATASWAAFRADPIWAKVRAESEKDGRIVEKAESVYLAPTDFSPLR